MCGDCGWEDLAYQIQEVLDEVLPEIPEAGSDFADSVEAKLVSIRDFAEEHQHVTDAQFAAAHNMMAAARRWLQ